MAREPLAAMPGYDLHVCLVSKQPLPNIIPLLAQDRRPRQVVLLVSADMRKKAATLRANLESLNCRVSECPVHPFRIEEIRAAVLELVASHDGAAIALNVTGGTKVMALGAYEVFRELGLPVFYIDTDNRQRIDLAPCAASVPLPDVMNVKLALAAYGYKMTASGDYRVAPSRRQLGDFLVQHVARLCGPLGVLNACAAAAKKQLQARLEAPHRDNPALLELLEKFREAGALDLAGERLVFADEEARNFCNGGWLEEYVLSQVNRLKGEGVVRDHGCNAVIVSGGGVKNEIDLAFSANNRLHLIECKTALMLDKREKEGRADAVAYKLEALRDLVGGTFAKAMLVTYRQLTPEDRRRCAEYRIAVVEGTSIGGLHERLRAWIG